MAKISRSLGVHDGVFHADEVTAAALLFVFGLIDRDKIIRTRASEKLATCEFVCDVGGIYDPKQKLFDHHQVEYKGDYSSAGMVLRYLADEKIITHEEYNFFNNSLIKGVDAHDNGKAVQEPGVCSFSHVIANFTPLSHDANSQEIYQDFMAAFDFTVGHLQRLKNRFQYNVGCREVVAEAMGKYRVCLIFNKSIPWQESFFSMGGKNHPALFVIMPAGSHWKLRVIPPDYERRMELRMPLPEKWAGLLGNDLKKASGISGAIFCHKGRFTSVWETKEDALKALDTVLKIHGIKNEDPI